MMRLAWTTNRAWLLAVSGLLLTSCGARSTMELSEYEDGGVEAQADGQADAPADVIYDHVNDINGCNPNTCGGCCDNEGDCRTGVETSACGIGGYACVNCSSFNATCNASNHQCGPTQACGPATCPNGCCDNGTCVSGTDSFACGDGGKTCMSCSSGTLCDPGSKQCVGTEECGPWNCSGCCDYDGYCNWGGDDWACGWGGNYCEDCWNIGGSCDPYQNACVPQQDCGPWNCDGCCDPYGYCMWGSDDWACGAKGNACDDCSMWGGYCDPDTQMCSTGEDCGPWNCGGCCTNTYPSYCVDGYEQYECGNSGNICQPCYPGQYCEAQPWGGGMCSGYYDAGVPDTGVPDCGPWNCDGCCMPGYPSTCMPGFEPFACGSSGQICQECWTGICEPTSNGGGVCYQQPDPDGGTGCGPWNCQGCCTQGGNCRPGTSNNRCGEGGEMCENCAAQNLICENGNCTP